MRTRLLCLSDLHFGQERKDLVEPLFRAIQGAGADLVVVAGDLVQRARPDQFRAAVGFLDRLSAPWIAVAGNHDIPLLDPVARIFHPFNAFRRHVGPDLGPERRIADLRLLGANSVDPWRWRRGIARPAEIARLTALLREGPKGLTNILVFHHPFSEPEGFSKGETRGADEALAQLGEAGLDLIVSGHLHHWNPGPGIGGGVGQKVLQIQLGTALSGRAGESGHMVATLDFDDGDLVGGDLADCAVTVTPWFADEGLREYLAAPPLRYRRRAGLWYLA